MLEDLALTFKQLLCPLLVVNRVPKSGWNIYRLDEGGKKQHSIIVACS